MSAVGSSGRHRPAAIAGRRQLIPRSWPSKPGNMVADSRTATWGNRATRSGSPTATTPPATWAWYLPPSNQPTTVTTARSPSADPGGILPRATVFGMRRCPVSPASCGRAGGRVPSPCTPYLSSVPGQESRPKNHRRQLTRTEVNRGVNQPWQPASRFPTRSDDKSGRKLAEIAGSPSLNCPSPTPWCSSFRRRTRCWTTSG